MTRYHFLGIAGTAMASVAAALRDAGCPVTGSDAGVYPPMSDFLRARDIPYAQSYDAAHVEAAVRRASAQGEEIVFVVGNAISRGNPELEEILNRKLRYCSLAGLVGSSFIAARTSLVVSGTHGKTTTAALAAWVLETAGLRPGFLIGGVTGNFGEGCRAAREGGIFVSEGDEYDTAYFDKRSKFMHYRPDILIVNNIEFDHADIFPSLDDIVRSFRHLVQLVPGNGLLLLNGDDARARSLTPHAHTPVSCFGLGGENDWRAAEVRTHAGGMRFVAEHHTGAAVTTHAFEIPLAGVFNVRNALGVIAAASHIGVPMHVVQEAFGTFRGVKRRMEIVAEADGIIVIDDFAHHPTAVRETLSALRDRYPRARLWAVFEPRSNTTTRNIFQNELAESFDRADEILIGNVNRPERYRPEEILDLPRLVADITRRGPRARAIPTTEGMIAVLRAEIRSGDVLVFLSNGSLGAAAKKVLSNT